MIQFLHLCRKIIKFFQLIHPIAVYRESFKDLPREIWVISLLSFINRAGSMVLPFLPIYLTSEKGYSLSTAGFIMMGYGIGSFFGNWLGGILTERVGPFRLQMLSLICSVFTYGILTFLENPYAIFGGLFAVSLIADLYRPANMSSVALLTNAEQRSRSIGLTRLAFNFGFTLGPAIGGVLVFFLDFYILFLIDALTCLIAGVLFYCFFRTRIRNEKWSWKVKHEEGQAHMKYVLGDRYMVGFFLLLFVYGLVFMQFFHAIPVYLKQEMGLSERWIGLFMASNGLLVVLFEMPVIHIFDKKNYLKLMSLGSFIVGLSFVVLITGIFPILFLTILFFTLGEMISFPFATTLIMNRSSDAMRGRYMAVYGMIFSLSHLISPGFGLSCADHFGFDWLWIICFILLTLVSFLLYKLKNHLV